MWLLVPLFVSVGMAPADTLVLRTGTATGSYQVLGEAIVRAVETHVPGLVLRTELSSGSVENVRAVAVGEADLAIVQNDIAYFADEGWGPFEGAPLGGLDAIVGLHYEDILLIARRLSGINSASQLRPQHRIVVGEKDSGTLENAEAVLAGLGFSLAGVDTLMRVPRRSLHLLGADSADAIFLTAGVGQEFLKEVEENGGQVVPLPDALIEGLRSRYPYFDESEIQLEERVVSTLRIRSLLLARAGLPNETVRLITEAIVAELPSIRAAHPRASEIFPSTLTDAVSIRSHAGARQALCEAGLGSCSQGFPYLLLAALMAAGGLVSLRFSKRSRGLLLRTVPILARHLIGPLGVTGRYRYVLIPVTVCALLVSGAFGVQRAEATFSRRHNVSSDFDDIGLNQNLVWMIVFTASGFEDGRFPQSTTAKLTSALMNVVGIGGVLLFFGLLTSDHIIKRIRMGRRFAPELLDGHVIVAGWSSRAAGIVRSLTDRELGPRRQFVVVLADVREDPIEGNDLDDEFAAFLRGIPSDLENLKKAGIDRADALIVLADEGIPRADRDARSLLTLILAEKHAHNAAAAHIRDRDLHTVVEIVDPANRQAMELAYADQIICRREFDERVLVQSVLNPGVAALLKEILTVDEFNEIIEVPVAQDRGRRFVGMLFREALATGLDMGALLVAIHKNGAPGGSNRDCGARELMVNPVGDNGAYKIRPGDSLLFLADSEKTLAPEFGDPREWKQVFHSAMGA